MIGIGSIVGWMLFGLVAGAIARIFYPGKEGLGLTMTMLLGVTGSLLGGGVAYLFRLGAGPYEPAGWVLSILGAVALLATGHIGLRKQHTV